MARWLALEVLMTDETVCERRGTVRTALVLSREVQQETLARQRSAVGVMSEIGLRHVTKQAGKLRNFLLKQLFGRPA